MIINLPRGVLELFRFASKDDSRRNLQVIHIDKVTDLENGDRLRAAATDGHRLTTYVWKPGEGFSEIPDEIFLDSERCKAALKGAKKTTNFELITETTTIKTSEGLTIEALNDYTNQYPDIDQVIPKEFEDKSDSKIGFNVRYLVEVQQYLDKVVEREKGYDTHLQVELNIKDDLSPMLLIPKKTDYLGAEIQFIVMPVRV